MKKILFFAIAIATLASCTKFLDVQPEGSPTADTYFENDYQAENSIKSLYAPFYDGDDIYGREIYWEQCAGNMMVPGRTRSFNTVFTMNYSGDESCLVDTYNCLFRFISRANWIVNSLVEKQKDTELTDVEKRTLGEAYFMRGFLSFAVAYRYGSPTQGAPLVRWEKWKEETGETYNYEIPEQPASVTDNYAAIIEDFESALPLVSSVDDYTINDKGRACKEACLAMEARVYSYWATWDKTQWNNVITCVNTLENTYHRALQPTYSELFDTDWDKWFDSEYCWSIPCNGGVGSVRAGVEFTGCTLENKGWGVYNGWGQFKPTQDLYEELAKDNVNGERNERLTKTILEYGDEFLFPANSDLDNAPLITWRFSSESDLEAGFQCNKYMEAYAHANFINEGYVNTSSGSWPTTRTNFTVIRFADCLLLRAEANIALGNAGAAVADINKVRERSHLAPISSATSANIYHERIAEFSFEPVVDHLGDLKRWACGGDATIKALAIAELESHPRVRHYSGHLPDGTFVEGYRGDPDGTYEIGPYLDYQSPTPVWADYKVCFPYPAEEIVKGEGKLKQNPGY